MYKRNIHCYLYKQIKMEDKSVMALKNRIGYLEHYIKKNLEPTIMSLYMDIDKLNKKVKSLSSNDSSSGASDPVANGIQATLGQSPNVGASAEPRKVLTPVESAIQTMEMLKQRNRRMNPADVEHMMNSRLPSQLSNSGKVIDN